MSDAEWREACEKACLHCSRREILAIEGGEEQDWRGNQMQATHSTNDKLTKTIRRKFKKNLKFHFPNIKSYYASITIFILLQIYEKLHTLNYITVNFYLKKKKSSKIS